MFTGLVTGVGEVVRVVPRQGVRGLTIRSRFPVEELRRGASVSVHGVCLTLIADGSGDGTFRVEAGVETLRRSVLGGLRAGSRVHLELAMRANDRLGGHLVQGHVDGIGKVRRTGRLGGDWILEIDVPSGLSRYIVEKGSICVDGVSLTVGRIRSRTFRVHVIPATAATTRLTEYRVGHPVNLEVDILAKYVESILGSGVGSGNGEGARGASSDRVAGRPGESDF
jgi:riboflavin synthase